LDEAVLIVAYHVGEWSWLNGILIGRMGS